MSAADVIERLNAALEGRYRIEREVGEGGMATVYVATDLRHQRRVAVKVLRPALAAVVGAERFLAEIHTTAALQHPHILPLHDSGEADGFLYYVMPYVEGESLRERLDRERQLPVEEAVALARKVAAALEYAHEQGVVHRDIKPANVLLSRGEPLVADFGIALALSEAGGGRITETGLSLGTPHYMSPEQAAGERTLDRRSDVYSLGCVLYEMLVGEPPFPGPTAQAVLSRILTGDPRRVTETRRTVPANVDAAVARALEKLPADRFEGAAAFARALADPAFAHEPARRGPALSARAARTAAATGVGSLFAGGAPLYALGSAAVLATVLAAWGWLRPGPDAPPAPRVQFYVVGDSTHTPVSFCCGKPLALSPDGTRLVYEAEEAGPQVLYQRPLGQLEARPIPGTRNARGLFFSPDGEWLGFVADGVMKKVRFDGGSPLTVTAIEGTAFGASWGGANTIVYTPNDTDAGLVRVSADGGAREVLTTPDTAAGVVSHRWPFVLPDGSAVLYVAWSGSAATARIMALSLETGETRELVRGTDPSVTADGHLVYGLDDGSLMAQPFDPRRLEILGPPARIAERVIVRPGGLLEYAMSRHGVLAVREGSVGQSDLLLVDRSGRREVLPTTGDVTRPAFSPDGRLIAYEVAGDLAGTRDDIWIYDLGQHNTRRLTFEGDNSMPAWSPDSRLVAFERDDVDEPAFYVRAADGSGRAEVLVGRDARGLEWAPDGRWLAWEQVGENSWDIWIQPADGSEEPRPFLATPFEEALPAISPDGRWIAYLSTESGTEEIYVQPFPEGGARFRVSTQSGWAPRWSADGTELFYVQRDELVAVTVQPGERFAVGSRTVLFDGVEGLYDVHPDGDRFVMTSGTGGAGGIVVTLNALSR